MNKFEELERIQKLRQNNVLTEKEFEAEKQKILNDTSSEKPNRESKKVKQKMKPWQIIVMILLMIVVRIYSVRYQRGSYRQL